MRCEVIVALLTTVAASGVASGERDGWAPPSGKHEARCDFASVEASQLSAGEFRSRFDGKAPVLIRNGAQEWPALKRWTKSFLFEKLGQEVAIHEGRETPWLHFQDAFTGPKVDGKYYAVAVDPVAFQPQDQPTKAHPHFDGFGYPRLFPYNVLKDITVPRVLQHWVPQEAHLYTHHLYGGRESSGLSFRTGAEFWIGLVAGRKHWLIVPPERAAALRGTVPWSKTQTGEVGPACEARMAWYKRFLGGAGWPEGERPAECVQNKGDVLYLPSRWAHADWSYGDTVAVSLTHTNLEYSGLDKGTQYRRPRADGVLNAAHDPIASELVVKQGAMQASELAVKQVLLGRHEDGAPAVGGADSATGSSTESESESEGGSDMELMEKEDVKLHHLSPTMDPAKAAAIAHQEQVAKAGVRQEAGEL